MTPNSCGTTGLKNVLRTKSGLPKGCVWNRDRENGKRRVHFRNRKTGSSVYLTGVPWSEDFMRQYASALEGSKAKSITIVGEKRTKVGSISALIVSYYASPGFKDLKASTQRARRNSSNASAPITVICR
jgi:hypothetical protein